MSELNLENIDELELNQERFKERMHKLKGHELLLY